jgi:hypothetical protein
MIIGPIIRKYKKKSFANQKINTENQETDSSNLNNQDAWRYSKRERVLLSIMGAIFIIFLIFGGAKKRNHNFSENRFETIK